MALLDEAIITEVRETLGDESYAGFAGRMLEDAEQALSELGALLAQGDLAALGRLAHRTGGAAVSVGAVGLHARMKEIEDAALANDAARLPTLIGSLSAVLAQTQAALESRVGPLG